MGERGNEHTRDGVAVDGSVCGGALPGGPLPGYSCRPGSPSWPLVRSEGCSMEKQMSFLRQGLGPPVSRWGCQKHDLGPVNIWKGVSESWGGCLHGPASPPPLPQGLRLPWQPGMSQHLASSLPQRAGVDSYGSRGSLWVWPGTGLSEPFFQN